MNLRRVFNFTKPVNSMIVQQVRFFARDPFPNKVRHYLYRANLIDSIRLILRSATHDSLSSLLSYRLLDSFIVKNVLRSAPSVSSAWSIFKTLQKNPQLSRNIDTLHAFATVLAKFHRVSELRSLIGVVDGGKFGKVKFTLMNRMNWYAIAGDYNSVLKIWDEYRCLQEEKVCTESYNIIMQTYMKMGRDYDAVKTFDLIINDGGIPNSRTFTVMIEHLISLGNLNEALEIYKILPLMRITRTLKLHSVLIEALIDEERFCEVKNLLVEMKDDGKFPGKRMMGPLKRMKDAGFEEETDEFLREMSPDKRIKNIYGYSMDDDDDDDDDDDEEVKLKPWIDPRALADALKNWNPNSVSTLEEANFIWTNLLVCKVLRNMKSPETAWSFFCWVAIQPGFIHDAYTIERMMTLLARHGHVELVDKLISKVRTEGIKLPFSTIRLIIELYGVSKKPDAALKIFRHDRTLCNQISDFNLMILYSSVIRTLTKCGRNIEALDMLDEMIMNNISPDIQTLSGLMYHFALQGEIQTVQRLFSMVRQIGLKPDAYMLKLIVEAYCKCERAMLGYRVFQDMKEWDVKPDKETKDLLVRSLWKEEKRKEAAMVEESYGEVKDNLPLKLRGHVWTIRSADIERVCNIYKSCVLVSSS